MNNAPSADLALSLAIVLGRAAPNTTVDRVMRAAKRLGKEAPALLDDPDTMSKGLVASLKAAGLVAKPYYASLGNGGVTIWFYRVGSITHGEPDGIATINPKDIGR